LLYPGGILPSRVSLANLPGGRIAVGTRYSSCWFDSVLKRLRRGAHHRSPLPGPAPTLGTNHTGKRCCGAGGWLGLGRGHGLASGQGGGWVWWSRARSAAGSSAAWLLAAASVWKGRSSLVFHHGCLCFAAVWLLRCGVDVCVCFLLLGLMRIMKDQF